MIKLITGLLVATLLTACGASGYPTAPPERSQISISGETRMGVVTGRGAIAESDFSINFGS